MSSADTLNCNLPLLDGAPSAKADFLEQQISPSIARELVEADGEELKSIQRTLCAAWGMLLRCYAGQDQVCFLLGHSEREDDLRSSPSIRHRSSVIRMALDEQDVLSQHLERVTGSHASAVESETTLDESAKSSLNAASAQDQFNTAVWIYTVPEDSTKSEQRSQNIQSAHPTGGVCLVAISSGHHLRLSLQSRSSEVSAGYLDSIAGTLESVLSQCLSSPHRRLLDLDYFSTRHWQRIGKWQPEPRGPVACASKVFCCCR